MFNIRKHLIVISVLVFSLAAICPADTFKNLQTGETFNGFATSRSLRGLTRVYNSDKEDFQTIDLNEYEKTVNYEGRRDYVIVIRITEAETLLSQVVSEQISKSIQEAADKGPKFILIELDSPGGRGGYMRNVAQTILETDNCPIYAYVTGGRFGGVFSASVGVALACDKIFISAGAVIGSVSPATTGLTPVNDLEAHQEVFSSDGLAIYRSYFSSLAMHNNRPEALSQAFVDNTMQIVEVKDAQANTSFIPMDQRTANQAIVKNLSQPVMPPADAESSDQDAVVSYIISINASDSVRAGLADKVVMSRDELLQNEGLAGAKLIYGSNVEKVIRRFTFSRQNLETLLSSIDYLDRRANEIKDQIGHAMMANRENQPRREYRADEYQQSRYVRTNDLQYSRDSMLRDRIETEVIIDPQQTDIESMYIDLENILADLVNNYRRAVTVARRYPGALPVNISLNQLELALNEAELRFDEVLNRPVYDAGDDARIQSDY